MIFLLANQTREDVVSNLKLLRLLKVLYLNALDMYHFRCPATEFKFVKRSGANFQFYRHAKFNATHPGSAFKTRLALILSIEITIKRITRAHDEIFNTILTRPLKFKILRKRTIILSIRKYHEI